MNFQSTMRYQNDGEKAFARYHKKKTRIDMMKNDYWWKKFSDLTF